MLTLGAIIGASAIPAMAYGGNGSLNARGVTVRRQPTTYDRFLKLVDDSARS